jgi:hypothetical protein
MRFEGLPRPRPFDTAARCLALVLIAAAAGIAACETRTPMRIRPGPVVDSSTIARSSEFMGKVAVMPFYPVTASGTSIGGSPQQVTWENAALISGYFAESLAAQGISVIPASDLEQAFAAQGQPVPRLDARTAALRAHEDYGATAVVIGKVSRWRERQGGAAGAAGPASVAFEVALHQAPTGRRLWTGRFDETQQSITQNILRARQYPGAGTHWMTAGEFARWGAAEVARSMNAAP